MAQLKSTVVQGSLRVTDTTYTTNLNLSSGTASQIIKTDANKNLVTGALTASEIPNLSANKITSDTLSTDRIPGLAASKINSGTFDSARIPNLSANKITSDTLGVDRIPNLAASKINSGTFDAARIPTLSITDKTSGTLTVGRGGTGATEFAANSLIMSGSTTTAALTTRAIVDRTSVNALTALATWAANTGIPTVNLIAHWDGRYQTTSDKSNLAYCNQGAFGNMAIKTKGNGFSDSNNTISVAYGTAANTAVQGNQTIFTLNGGAQNSGSNASFYAPTSAGTANQILVSKGGASAPEFVDQTYELPSGGTTNQALVKNSENLRDVKWAGPYLPLTGGHMTGSIHFDVADVARQTKPADHKYGTFEFRSANGADRMAIVEYARTKEGNSRLHLYVMGDAPSGTNVYSGIVIERTFQNTSNYSAWYTVDTGRFSAQSVAGAIWNDYAEFRKDNIQQKAQQTPGHCVVENGDGTLSLSTSRLQAGAEIITDTYGFSIGEDKENNSTTPLAVSGRVLAYPYESIDEFRNNIGAPVCSGPNGTVSIMTTEEEKTYPSRIIGTISEIPTYERWGSGNVEVNGRVWIRIR